MFIHYFIILYGSTVVFSSINNCSRLIFIIHSIKSRHRKNPTMETSLKTIDKSNLTNTRIRRDFLRENTINDRDNVNFYSDNDGKYFRNQPEEPKRAYYLPMNQKISTQSYKILYMNLLSFFRRSK
jgi:hypothetical protein